MLILNRDAWDGNGIAYRCQHCGNIVTEDDIESCYVPVKFNDDQILIECPCCHEIGTLVVKPSNQSH